LPDLAGSEPFRDPTPAESELSALLAAGMQVLPEAGLEALATWLRVHAQPGHLFHYGRSWHSAADALLERGLLAPGLFAFVLGARRPRNETDEQRILWQLYTHPDPRGAELVREVVAALPLPRPDDYVSGVPWKQPWQGLQTRAWETGDLTLLAACFERCALQTWSKGAKAFLPEVRTPVLEGWQANSVPTDGGVPLEEVWAAVRDADPERAPRILAALLACAEADELPAQVLRIAARDSALLAHGYRFAPGALLDLVESPGARAVNLGLELLLAQPEAAAGMTLALVDAAARHLRGAASGPAKAAARALGVLAAAEADARPAALEALGDALFASQAPRVEAALRALGALAKAAPLALSAEVQARLRALSDGPHAKQATGVLAQVQV
ncbi:MAG: hypothetical protein R3F62_23085, partial [Planctomycetota bacterium]